MFQRIVLSLAITAALAACGSNVKLDDTPVEDRSATAVTPGGTAPGSGPAATESRVAPVAADSASNLTAGPANVSRIVFFDYDSFVIKPEFQNVIEAHARFLRQNTQRRVSIEGHTDERGGREYNLALGQKRAEAVRRALALLGVPDGQVEAVSFGEEKPSSAGSDESSWAQNRRAEITYR